MPQMSPLNWLFLYFYMLLILLLINVILNYLFIKDFNNKAETKQFEKKMFKWMW